MTATTKDYICPGETHPIPRSVHLARMAAFYPKCGDCPFRGDTGQLVPEFASRQTTGGRGPRRSLVTTDGLRGIFINQLGRGEAFALTAAFTTLLWEDSGRLRRDGGGRRAEGGGRKSEVGDRDHSPLTTHRSPLSTRPTVVVGYDQRPSSPELVAGVFDALRQTGCGIIDAGPATTPFLWWNVAKSAATGGVLVTGAGCDPSWSGLEFVGPDSAPISSTASVPDAGSVRDTLDRLTLEQIEARSRLPLNRPTRSAGEFHTVRNWATYEASVAEHFHALRPLRVVVGTGTALLQRASESLFRRLPCELVAVPLPTRARRLDRPDDPDVLRGAAAIRETDAHVGVLIDDDGQTCALLEETGRLIPSDDVAQLLSLRIHDAESGATIISETDLPNSTRAAMFTAMQPTGAAFGGGASGRFWLRDNGPVCDALLTLAAILSALSRSDAECSRVFAPSLTHFTTRRCRD